MSYIDVTGKTEAIAIENALAQLHLTREDVSVEILERPKSGFLGIGATPAKVRVSYEGKEEESTAKEQRKGAFAPEKIADRKAAKAETKEKAPAAKKAEPMNKDELRRALAGKEEKLSGGKGEKAQRTDSAERREGKVATPYVPSYEGTEAAADDADANSIKAFLSGLMEHMEIAATVKVFVTEDAHYKVYLEGERMGQVIGRRGETLDAIQQLTNYSINRGRDERVRIHVDAENYRAKREDSLQSLANKVAGKVVKYGRSMTLEPMNAYERHVIHTALQDHPRVTTHSTGTEPNRRVVVSLDRSKAR